MKLRSPRDGDRFRTRRGRPALAGPRRKGREIEARYWLAGLGVGSDPKKQMALPWLILGSGSRSSKIKIAPAVFERLPGARIVPGLSVDEISLKS